jgi:hypothetical protein
LEYFDEKPVRLGQAETADLIWRDPTDFFVVLQAESSG